MSSRRRVPRRRLAMVGITVLLAAACGGTTLEVGSDPASTTASTSASTSVSTSGPTTASTAGSSTVPPTVATTTTEAPDSTTSTSTSTPTTTANTSQRAPDDEIAYSAGTGPGVPVGLQIGDCQENGVDDISVAFRPADSIDCTEPHLSEIVAIYTFEDGTFPGAVAAGRVANVACQEGFEANYGIEYRRTPLSVGPVYPTAATWNDGDRAILCAATFEEPVSQPIGQFEPDEIELPDSQIYSFFLAEGDCLDGDQNPLDTLIFLTPCAEPHIFEVFSVIRLVDGPFPGDFEIEAIADELCTEDFETYTGGSILESDLDFTTLTPTEEGWTDFDDHTTICLLQAPEPIAGSSRAG